MSDPASMTHDQGDHLCRSHLSDAPVKALGIYGGYCLIQDAFGERHALQPDDFTPLRIVALFGPHQGWLAKLWPPTDAVKQVRGWDPDRAGESLIAACAHAGVVDPARFG